MQFERKSFPRYLRRSGIQLLTISLLVFIILIEGYPRKMYESLRRAVGKDSNQAYSYQENEYYREQTDFYSLYNSQKNIVMLGNSLTYRIHWSELLGRQDVANRGIGSDITAGFLHRLQSIVTVKPKICFIEGGINDIFHGIPADSTLHNISLLADSLRFYGIKVAVNTVAFIAGHHPKAQNYNPVIQSLNEGIRNLAREKNLHLVDLNPEIAENNQLKADCVLSDGIHLTSKAYRVWKKQVEEILQKEGI